MKEPKKVVSYYLKVANDDFVKKYAKKKGVSKNEVMDRLIESLMLEKNEERKTA